MLGSWKHDLLAASPVAHLTPAHSVLCDRKKQGCSETPLGQRRTKIMRTLWLQN